MGTGRQRPFRGGAVVTLWLLLAACGSSSEPETDYSSGSDATVAATAADGVDGSDGADGVGTAGTGGAGGGAPGSDGGGEDPDDGPGRPPSPLYIEPIQAFGGPGYGFVTGVEGGCAAVKAGPRCVTLTFEPPDRVDDDYCRVSRTEHDVRYKEIAVGTKLTVYLECPEPSEEEFPETETSETSEPAEGDQG
jgi:hypothetical protein